jgi:ribosomal protein S1
LESFPAQSMVKGKVTRLADFGAFIEITPGVEGLAHISELSEKRIKTCSEVVQPGQEVEARVLGVDKENRRISLSLKPATTYSPESHDMAVASAQAAAAKPSKLRKKPLRGGLSSHFDW